MRDPIEQFRDAIQAAGLTPPELIEADGKLHRFASNGKRGDDAGWYVYYANGIAAGAFGCWRSGMSQSWRADIGRRLTPTEEAEHRAKVQAMRRARDAEEARRRSDARAKTTVVWRAATPARADHPYLLRKGVQPVDTLREIAAEHAAALLGYAPQAKGEPLAGRLLVAPVKVGGALSTLELIDDAGRKSAVAGGAKAGGYWATQALPQGDGEGITLLIGEGVATVLSAREATGHPAVAALSCANLARAAQTTRSRYPAARIVILADAGNGQQDAEGAARAVGALVATPAFTLGEVEAFRARHGKPPTDVNDLHQICGVRGVRALIEAATAPSANGAGVELICAVDVASEPVRWLWREWLAAGKLHLIGGAPGTGKTTLALALAATLTSGGRWPDGTRSDAGSVLIWSGEDDMADTLRPRLEAMRADLARVYFVGSVPDEHGRRPFDPATDMRELECAAAAIAELRMLIVDPVVSAVAGDSHRNAEVRRGLQPVVDFAQARGVATLGITHFSKGTQGRDPLERLTGSLAFGALARVAFAAAKLKDEDGDEYRVFVRVKNNVGPSDGGYRYTLEPVEFPSGVRGSRILWGEAISGEAREILAVADADPSERDAVTEAGDFLRDLLADGPLPAMTIRADADGAGFSWATIRRAQKALGIETRKSGLRGGWTWALPPKMLTNPEDAQQKGVSTFGQVEHLRADDDPVEIEI